MTRPKPLLLLAHLALEGAKPRRYLAELFFSNAADPADALSSTLRRLRAAGDVVSFDGRMVTATIACDACRLLDLVDAGTADEAWELVEGPFLADVDLTLGAELEEWVFAMREYLAGRVRSGLVAAAERAFSGRDLRRATAWAEAATSVPGAAVLGPEEARRLHAILDANGSPKAAEVRQEAGDLGLALPDEPAQPVELPPRTASGRLPVPLTPLIGRDPELLDLAAAIRRPDVRILTLHGPAGVGKTRLAVHAAHEQARAQGFGDGVAFVELDGLARSDLVPGAIAAAVGVEPLGWDDAWSELAHQLQGGRRLIVLDSLEHVIDAAGHLPRLLAAAPATTILATSRERLHVDGEWVMAVQGLPVPHEGQRRDEALRVDALALFAQRARRSYMTFHLTDQELPHATAICRRVGGLPLALELAASWTRAMPLAEVAAILKSAVDVTDSARRDVPPRHRSMAAALEHSWTLRSEAERAILRRLSVFRGGFRRDAAARVAGATVADLARLADASLLHMLPNGRFDRHALVHEFTDAKAEQHPDERAEARERHARFVVDLLRDARERSSQDPQAVFTLLEEEEADVVGCLEWAIAERRDEVLLALSEPLLWYFPMRGRFAEGADLFARATERLDPEDRSSREALASMLVGRSFFARYAGNLEASKRHATRAARLAHQGGSELEMTRALHMLGQVVTFEGDYARATGMLTEAARLADALAAPLRRYRILCDLVNAASLLGAYDEASAHADAALVLESDGAIAVGFDAVALRLSIGVLDVCRRAWSAAEATLIGALDMATELDYQGPVPVVRALLAQALIGAFREGGDAERLARARHEVDRGLAAARVSNEGMALSMLHGVASSLAAQDGHADLALERARDAARIAWQNRNLTILFWAFPNLIDANLARGRLRDAALAVGMAQAHRAAPQWVRLRAAAASAQLHEPADVPVASGSSLDRGMAILLGGTGIAS